MKGLMVVLLVALLLVVLTGLALTQSRTPNMVTAFVASSPEVASPAEPPFSGTAHGMDSITSAAVKDTAKDSADSPQHS